MQIFLRPIEESDGPNIVRWRNDPNERHSSEWLISGRRPPDFDPMPGQGASPLRVSRAAPLSSQRGGSGGAGFPAVRCFWSSPAPNRGGDDHTLAAWPSPAASPSESPRG